MDIRQMHDVRFDLNLLRVFEAIYHGGSVTRAAEALNLSQPAVSHALKRLRDHLQDPLFVRLGQGLTPTPAAQQLIEPVRRALRAIESAMNNVGQFEPASATMCLRIGFNALMEESQFPAIVAAILPLAPGIRVESVRYDRAEMAILLASSQLDAVVDVEVAAGEMVHSRKISSRTIVGVASADHAIFADGTGQPSLDDYMELRHVTVSTRPRGASFEDAVIARFTTRHRTIVARCQSTSAALQLVGRSDLVTTVPVSVVGDANLPAMLRTFRLPLDMPPINSHLYWHTGRDADQAHVWLREKIFTALA